MTSRIKRLPLALLLLCILIFSTSNTNISAATKFTLSNGKTVSSTLYANHNYTLNVKKYRVYFYSNNNHIISVNKQTGKLTVKEPGYATISAKSRYTGITICKKTFVVKRRTDYLYTNSKSMTLVTGETSKVSVKISPLNSTDVIRYQSSNSNIVKVNSTTGKVTAVGTGTAYVHVYSKANASYSNSDASNKTIRIKVKVYSSITSAKQVGLDQVEVTFSGAPAALTYQDFSLVNASNQVVKVVAVSVTDNTALLTLSRKVTDGQVYSVLYKSSTCSFTATDAKIAKFVLSQTSVPINTDTPIIAYSYDKYGIQIGEYTYGNTYTDITFTVSSSYLTNDKKLKFTSTRGTALVRLIYNQTINGIKKAIVDSGSMTITSFDPDLVYAQYRCHITSDSSFTFTQSTQCNLSIPIDTYINYAYFNVITSSGKEVSDYSKYYVESSDRNILFTGGTTIDNNGKYIMVYPLKTGTAYLHVKDANGSILYSFPVTVRPASVLTNFTASNNSLYMTNDQANITSEVTLNAFDQYGININDRVPYITTIECTSTTAKYVTTTEVNSNSAAYYSLSYPKLTFYSNQLQPGTYTYKVTMNTKSTYITVVIGGNEVRSY